MTLPLFVTRAPRTRQPQEPARASQRFLARRPLSRYLGSIGPYGTDLVTGAPVTPYGPFHLHYRRITSFGIGCAVEYDWGSHGFVLAAAADAVCSASWTCLVAMRYDVAVTRAYAGYRISASDVVSLGYGSGGDFAFAYGSETTGAGGGAVSASGQSFNAGDLELMAYVAGPNVGRQIWRNGALIASDATATAARPSTAAAFKLCNHEGTVGAGSGVTIFEMMAFPAELSAAEIRAWCADRLSIFAPIERRAWLQVSAPALVLASDGSLQHTSSPSGSANKLYLTTAGALQAKTAPGAGDRRISLSGGNWLAT